MCCRAQEIPFVISIEEKGDRLKTALTEANEFMEHADYRPWPASFRGLELDPTVRRGFID